MGPPVVTTALAPEASVARDRAGRSVLVAHPGAAHFIYELVNAVGALGFAPRFETGFYYDDTGTPISTRVRRT